MTPLGPRPAQSAANAALFVLIGAGLSAFLWAVTGGTLGPWPLVPVIMALIASAYLDRTVLKRTPLDLPLALFLATALMGVGMAYDPDAARHKFWLILGGCVVAYAIAIQPPQNLWSVATSLAVLGAVAALIFLVLVGWRSAPFPAVERWAQHLRLAPSVSPPSGIPSNVFGSVMALLFPFQLATLWHAHQRRKTGRQVLFAVMILLTALALALALERSILLALAAGLSSWLFWRRFGHRFFTKHRIRRLLAALLLVTILIAIVILFRGSRWQALTTIDRLAGSGTILDRAQLAGQSIDLINAFPLTGGGLASFPGLHARYILGIPFYFLPNAHNILLDVTLEQGPLGLLAFSLLGAIVFWQLLPLVTRVSDTFAVTDASLLSGAALSSFLVLLLHGMVEDTVYGSAALPLLFVVPAMTVALSDHDQVAHRRQVWRWDRNTGLVVGGAALVLLGVSISPSGRARWQANLAAVSMAQTELRDFPAGSWVETAPDGALQVAERQFQTSLQLDRTQRTARYRLGLMAMQRQDFVRAIDHLQIAYAQDPDHVGIRKALGYSYAWAGDLERAGELLATAPFISQELDAYVTWWRQHERPDLAQVAAQMRAYLQTNDIQTVNE